MMVNKTLKECAWEALLRDMVAKGATVGEIESSFQFFWSIPEPKSDVMIFDGRARSVYYIEMDDEELEGIEQSTRPEGAVEGLSVRDQWLMEGLSVLCVAFGLLCVISWVAEWWVFR